MAPITEELTAKTEVSPAQMCSDHTHILKLLSGSRASLQAKEEGVERSRESAKLRNGRESCGRIITEQELVVAQASEPLQEG